MAETVLRPFAASDSPRLLEVLETVFAEYGMKFDPQGFDRDVLSIETRYAPPEAVFYAAEIDGRVVGFAGADMPRPGVAELHRLYMDPAARGRGLGARLVATVEDWARGRGATTLELWSDVRLCHAHVLYARLGYGLVGQRLLGDPDRSVEFGFRRSLARPPEPVFHSLFGARSLPLEGFLGTEREHWALMLAAAIFDSRALVRAGRVRDGGLVLPSPLELFPAGTAARDVEVLELPGPVLGGFAHRGRSIVRAHPLFGG